MSAVKLVENGFSICNAAKQKGVNYSTLSRYVKIKSTTGTLDTASIGYKKTRQVFLDELESLLVDYLVHAARTVHGLTITELRTLDYDLAVANEIDAIPPMWSENHVAGEEWDYSFMKRHKHEIAVRTPEPTSIQRMTNFNEDNVNIFFSNLETALARSFVPTTVRERVIRTEDAIGQSTRRLRKLSTGDDR